MKHVLAILAFSVTGLFATDTFAYIGPGAGISAIGTLLALFATVALAIVGFVWYPIKRHRRRLREKRAQSGQAAKSEDAGE